MSGPSRSSVKVLLLWPGADASTRGNFGMPQLVLLGTYAQHQTGAKVQIRDLEMERAFGPVNLARLLAGPDGEGYDIVALSAYSSFDHLKCTAIAEMIRELHPNAVIMVGGYHPSARPLDYVFDGSPFDVAVVGEGEKPLVRVIESVAGGAPLRQVVLGPEAIARGAVVVDVGINRIDAPERKTGTRLVGDVDYDALLGHAGAMTPVPGGVGPMTIAMLLENTWEAMCRAEGWHDAD